MFRLSYAMAAAMLAATPAIAADFEGTHTIQAVVYHQQSALMTADVVLMTFRDTVQPVNTQSDGRDWAAERAVDAARQKGHRE